MELGEKHARYGVKPEYFPSMGRALVATVETLLTDGNENDDKFSRETKDAWIEVYNGLSYDMIRAQKSKT